jgi:hypothetical protein
MSGRLHGEVETLPYFKRMSSPEAGARLDVDVDVAWHGRGMDMNVDVALTWRAIRSRPDLKDTTKIGNRRRQRIE